MLAICQLQFCYVGLVPKKQTESTKCNESTSPNSPAFIRQEGEVVASEKGNVVIQQEYDSTSTEGVLKAVNDEGSHTLSLEGEHLFCSDSKNL